MLFPLHVNLHIAFPQEPTWGGRCSTALASSFPPPVTTCFLPQHLDPPHSTAAFSLLGPTALSVTHKCCVSSDPCGFPVIVQLPSACALTWTDSPQHFCCQPDARPHHFPSPFCWPPVSVRCFRDSQTYPFCPLTPPSLMVAHLLGLCPLSSPWSDYSSPPNRRWNSEWNVGDSSNIYLIVWFN